MAVLNDLSDDAVRRLRSKFVGGGVEVTQVDFRECVDRYRGDSRVVMVLDPPWRHNIYANNTGPVLTMKPRFYYADLLDRLRGAACRWWLCSDRAEVEINHALSRSGFRNVVLQHTTRVFFGRPAAVRLATNTEGP